MSSYSAFHGGTIQLTNLRGGIQFAGFCVHSNSIRAAIHTVTGSTPIFDDLPVSIQRWARELGFADAGIAELQLGEDLDHLRHWLDQGMHGGMEFMQRNLDLREHPAQLRPGTVSVISARLDYRPHAEAADRVLKDGERAYISRYALGRDYHRLMRARLLKLGKKIEEAIGPHGYRVFSDSAPALEKALARNARLGWIGKNTLLLNKDAGSWFFLGEIYTDLALPVSTAEQVENRCGKCSACIKICPTQAFIGPYKLDARRCISYLTIEHHGAIPLELRPMMGNRIFGCDDCQLVCPWNRYAKLTNEPDFAPRHSLDSVKLTELFSWSEEQWLSRTEGMALRRAGYNRWLRNIAVALGNAPKNVDVVRALQTRAEFPDEIVREHVEWALQQQTQAA
ncbi:tRNA epoxyqueuosine(34) reductase QueG [Stenotrophobium rhamnosiphilum]|uniref:Epoxyqueuosine reductase n=1 Tax=Stenotrophobium rhamnosiphilum TaxID=2029166 RepID=A0A2T5MET1_9GAMM|nr:tRNA epoxyqueuosine(34) reductase QueG [Stenotrophobium rhamnosiphilum]